MRPAPGSVVSLLAEIVQAAADPILTMYPQPTAMRPCVSAGRRHPYRHSYGLAAAVPSPLTGSRSEQNVCLPALAQLGQGRGLL